MNSIPIFNLSKKTTLSFVICSNINNTTPLVLFGFTFNIF